MPNFDLTPGYWFVVATLLPLASFTVLLLASAAWSLARRYGNDRVEKALGSPDAGKAAAYIAMGAIGLAFVCSLTGFVQYLGERSASEGAIAAAHHRAEELKHEKEGLPATIKEKKDALAAAGADDKAALQKEIADLELRQEHLTEEAEAAEHLPHKLEAMWEEARATRWQGTLFTVFQINNVDRYGPKSGSSATIGFKIDSLSALMFVMVTFVATLIHLFSSGYMADELPAEDVADHHVHTDHGHLHRRGRYSRFFMYLSLFCFSMLNLVLADNLFQVFVSWELVGVCSFLLIGFYFERKSAGDAANKAFITNRVGDAGFILGLLIVWGYLGTFNFDHMFAQVRHPMNDAHGTPGRLAGKIVRADVVPGTEGKEPRLRVTGPGEGGRYAVLFPLTPLSEELSAEQSVELKSFRKRLTAATDPAERARLERQIAALDTEHHFHSAGRGQQFTPHADRRPEEYGAMPYWMLVVAGLGIFLGCVGKSAQFPLQVWLPDAMEGPTPVSALIHAATMVAAGVYLVGRCYPLFTPEVLLVISYTGAITLFVAATIAIVVDDIKKVLAYSTVSQLGFMMLGLGVGGWAAGLFHLITHAVFKALMFLASGAVIYNCHHEQDMQKMGGLYPKMKITALTMLMGVLAISGVPLFSGWYSKDAIVAHAFGFAYVHREHALLFILPLVTAGITTFYMFRMWFLTFAGKPRDHHLHDHAHESPWMMTAPLVILAVLAVVCAWGVPPWDPTKSALEGVIKDSQPVSVAADFGLEHYPHEGEHSHEALPVRAAKPEKLSERHWAHEYHDFVGLLLLGGVAVGLTFAAATYYFRALDPAEAKEQFPAVHAFLVHKWYFDEVYDALLVRPVVVVGRAFAAFDKNVLDGTLHALARGTVAVAKAHRSFDTYFVDWLVNLTASVIYRTGNSLRGVQTGFLRSYVLFLALGAVALFVLLSYFVATAAAR
ncbi:MAG: proton-conducting transporter membrane subunit [Gemmataceae bacterium]